MNSNQRSQGNNQSSNGGNEKSESSSRGDFVEKENLNQQNQQNQQSQQQPSQGQQQDSSRSQQQSTDRTGSQTGSQQQGQPGQKQSNDVAGGLPKSPGGANQLSADEDMDDDTGLSNRGNRQSAGEIDEGTRQSRQSNVGRRSDGTPD